MFALCLSNANKGSFVFSLLTRETSADYQNLQYAHRKDLCGSYFRIWTIHQIMKLFKGPFIYDVHKKIAFSTPLPLCPHGPDPPVWTSTHGQHEIHTALLKWLVR